jgi:O-antigen/teichoic acid export membrane protein
MVGRLWSAVLSLLSVPIFLGFLGPEAYGLVGLYASFEVVFNFLDLGLSATVNREIARNVATNQPGQESKNLLKTFEYFYWAIGFAVAILIASLAGWIAHNWVVIHDLSSQQVQVSIYMMAFMFAARWPMTLYGGVFRGLQKQLLQNSITIVVATIRVIAAIVLLKYISHEVTIFLTWQAISCVLEIFILILLAWGELNKISKEKPRMDLQIIKQVWRFALSFNIVGVLGMLLAQAGSLIASKFVNLSEIGYYSVAGTAAGSLSLIAYSIDMAVSPRFAADTARDDKQSVRVEFHRYVRIINYFVFGFASILILFPSTILYMWIRDWTVVSHTSPILIFLVGASLFNSVANTGYTLLIASGNTKIPLLCNTLNFIIFIPVLLILIPREGILPAAVVWFLENIISFLVYNRSVMKLFIEESFLTFLKKDVAPYMIASLSWFLCGKFFCFFVDNETIKLVIIIAVAIGYFISMLPRIVKDASVEEAEIVSSLG